MPTAILEALNDAGLYEQATGVHVDVFVVPDYLYKTILNMKMVFVFNWDSNHTFIPAGLDMNL